MQQLRLPKNTVLHSELEIKRSRFIAVVARTNTVPAARELLAELRSEYPDARHHCSAYAISTAGAHDVLNSSDDGEPSGTAGRPMLDVLTGNNLIDISAVVVRYFGGTLLGTGGLVRAYSDAVRYALSGAPLVRQERYARYRISAPHTLAGKLEADLRARDYEILAVNYRATDVTVDVAVAEPDIFLAELAQLTAGTITATTAGEVMNEVPAGHLPEVVQ
ncbi:MAG: YigZ family protein [Trueperella sp.]|nr:YigZ family protein [Trueperella sp.]